MVLNYIKLPYLVSVQAFIAACMSLSELTNGFGVGWSAPIVPKFANVTQSPLPYAVTDMQMSWVVSIAFFGCFGAFPVGYLANTIGRKNSILIGGFLNLTAYTLLAVANNLMMLYLGRLLVGVTVCYMGVLVMVYIGEIAPPEIRGIILAIIQASHAFGSLLVYSVGPFTSYRNVCCVNVVLILVFIVSSFFLPESPMFYVLRGDETSARNILSYLGSPDDINTELKSMIERVQQQKNDKHIWKELLYLKCNRKSVLITTVLSVFQQGSGVMAVLLYANTIFEYAGSTVRSDVATIVVGITSLVGAVAVPLFIDKYGRRMLLLVSATVLFITMLCLGVYFYLKETQSTSVSKIGWLPLVLLVAAQFAYSFGFSVIPHTLSSEMFSPRVRGLGSLLALTSAMMSGFIFISLFSYVSVAIGIHYTFWLFATSNALALLFVIFYVPETMGKSLLEIQEMLEK